MNTHIDSHFYLYAKGFYKRTNIIGDCRKIIAKTCLIDVELVTEEEVMEYLLKMVFVAVPFENSTKNHKVLSFIEDIGPSNFWKHKDTKECPRYDFTYAVIAKCLQVLSNATVNDIDDEGFLVPIFKLENPNPDILPVIRQKVNLIGEVRT